MKRSNSNVIKVTESPLKQKASTQKLLLNDNISSDEESYSSEEISPDEYEGSDAETPDEKRRRLAKSYLQTVQRSMKDGENDADSVDDNNRGGYVTSISKKLQSDRLRKEGDLHLSHHRKFIELGYESLEPHTIQAQNMCFTSMSGTSDLKTVLTGSKDNAVVLWDVETGKRQFLKLPWSSQMPSETSSFDGEVLTVAIMSDGQTAACGGRDRVIRVFDPRAKSAEVRQIRGHNGPVSAVSFQSNSSVLYSGSFDRTIKRWDMASSTCMDTLFGHQDKITSLDCWKELKPLSGSTDRSLRLWKVDHGSHLVFRKHSASVDCVHYLDRETFVSGGQDGRVNLWSCSSRAPVSFLSSAHGVDSSSRTDRWITSISALRSSDCFASGSYSGAIKVWSVTGMERKDISAKALLELPASGFVNDIILRENMLVACCSREHKLGRWWSMPYSECKNKVLIYKWSA